MRVLSLTQPWATLVAIGAKRIETRSWRTYHRGLLAIHAAKGFPKWAREYAEDDEFQEVLQAAGIELGDLPFGAIIAVSRLRSCIPTEEAVQHISDQECAFGDYSPGRWAWTLSDVSQLIRPVPARGFLGLWDWNPSVDEARALGLK